MSSLVYDTSAGALATLDTATLRALPMPDDYIPAPDHTDTVIDGDGIDALEWTVTAAWDPVTRALTVTPDQHALDATGQGDVGGIAFLTDTSDVPVCFVALTPVLSGSATVTFGDTALPGAVAVLPDAVALTARVDDLDTRVTALETTPPGGGGVQSIVPGAGVTVDDADPEHPVVSATGGGPVDAPTPWGAEASWYVDRGRVWLAGSAGVDGDGEASVSLGVLPPAARPDGLRAMYLIAADGAGAQHVALMVGSDGEVTLGTAGLFTGEVTVLLESLSFGVAS